MKICISCGVEKELIEFTIGKNKRNGVEKTYVYNKCKTCERPRKNAGNILYKKKNRKTLADKQRDYYVVNKAARSDYSKKHYQDNKEQVKARIKKNTYRRRRDDVSFRLKETVSASIRMCIVKNNRSFTKYLPYSIKELKTHLENQFESWMNWENYGTYRVDIWSDNDVATWTWQLDHIIPHSKFKYSSMEDDEFKACWALKNLRPYSAKQNVVDGARSNE